MTTNQEANTEASLPPPDPGVDGAISMFEPTDEELAEYHRIEQAALLAADRDEYNQLFKEAQEAEARLQEVEETQRTRVDGSSAIPASDLSKEGSIGAPIIEDILYEGQVVSFNAEEGSGKTTLAWEIGAQLTSGGPVLGEYAVMGNMQRVLIIDFEQSRDDALLVHNEVVGRGMDMSGIFWLDASGKVFDDMHDNRWLRAEVQALRPDVVILDTGTEAVSKPSDDEVVKVLFTELRAWMRTEGVRGVVMLGQARKRDQNAQGPRKFDDLFGSRMWKGRASAAFWIEGSTLTVWKQRGDRLKKRWGSKDRQPQGRLTRTHRETHLLPPLSADDRRTRILAIVRDEPDKWSKSSLVQQRLQIKGDARKPWTAEVDALINEGELKADGQYNRLTLD